MNIGVAYGLAELILVQIVDNNDLPKIDVLKTLPKVALLYTTYNDAMPKILEELKNQFYENYDIFILDDSTDDRFKKIVDSYLLKTIRRSSRKGFKAGALNNWINCFGDGYEYFVILDSDSSIEPDFIYNMVKYGEHPFNYDVAIFQSKINCYNNITKFAKILSITAPLVNYVNNKLANQSGSMLSWVIITFTEQDTSKKLEDLMKDMFLKIMQQPLISSRGDINAD